MAPRACVRVYPRVLVPPNLYIDTYTYIRMIYKYNEHNEFLLRLRDLLDLLVLEYNSITHLSFTYAIYIYSLPHTSTRILFTINCV